MLNFQGAGFSQLVSFVMMQKSSMTLKKFFWLQVLITYLEAISHVIKSFSVDGADPYTWFQRQQN